MACPAQRTCTAQTPNRANPRDAAQQATGVVRCGCVAWSFVPVERFQKECFERGQKRLVQSKAKQAKWPKCLGCRCLSCENEFRRKNPWGHWSGGTWTSWGCLSGSCLPHTNFDGKVSHINRCRRPKTIGVAGRTRHLSLHRTIESKVLLGSVKGEIQCNPGCHTSGRTW